MFKELFNNCVHINTSNKVTKDYIMLALLTTHSENMDIVLKTFLTAPKPRKEGVYVLVRYHRTQRVKWRRISIPIRGCYRKDISEMEDKLNFNKVLDMHNYVYNSECFKDISSGCCKKCSLRELNETPAQTISEILKDQKTIVFNDSEEEVVEIQNQRRVYVSDCDEEIIFNKC